MFIVSHSKEAGILCVQGLVNRALMNECVFSPVSDSLQACRTEAAESQYWVDMSFVGNNCGRFA